MKPNRVMDVMFVLFSVEKFFQMKKGQCKDALEIYKKFLTRMTRVSEFLKIAEVKCKQIFYTYEHAGACLIKFGVRGRYRVIK